MGNCDSCDERLVSACSPGQEHEAVGEGLGESFLIIVPGHPHGSFSFSAGQSLDSFLL
jgi:hypothetical protein